MKSLDESPLNTGRVGGMTTPAPFGRLLTAMVTPFTKDGDIDWAGVETLAAHLVANGYLEARGFVAPEVTPPPCPAHGGGFGRLLGIMPNF